ncbi:condensation domain-containing protein [Streptomyces sp. NPDC054933]
MTLSDVRVVRLPLSAAQREIWLAQQRDPESPHYRIGEYLEIHGPVDPVAFESAMRRKITEAEPFNVRFREDAGAAEQIIEPISDWDFPVLDVSGEADPRAAAESSMRADLARPMNLERDPLFSFGLLKLGPERYAWYQSCHHIVADGFGGVLIARRVAELYTALVARLPAEPAGFGSLRMLVERDAHYRSSADFAVDRHHWTRRLADPPEPARLTSLPTRAPRETLHHSSVLPSAAATRLHNAARQARTLPSAMVLATTAAYLHRLTGRREVVLGLPVTARTDAALRSIGRGGRCGAAPAR